MEKSAREKPAKRSLFPLVFFLALLLATTHFTALPLGEKHHRNPRSTLNSGLPMEQEVLLDLKKCVSHVPAQRTGRNSCWAQFRLDSSHLVCVPHSTWTEWLKRDLPTQICSQSSLPWKAYSPPMNSPLHSSFQSDRKPMTAPKMVIWIQTLHTLPSPKSSDRSKFSRVLHRIERMREKTSELMAVSDPFGIFRSLVLNEGAGREPLPLFRKLGFVHLTSATGIHLYAIAQASNSVFRSLTQALSLPLRLGLWLSRFGSLLAWGFVWILSGARVGMLRPWGVILLKTLSDFLGMQWRKGAPLLLTLSIHILYEMIGRPRNETLAGSPFEPSLNYSVYAGVWVYGLAVGGGLYWYSQFKWIHLGLAIGSWLLVALWEAWQTGILALATPLFSLITLPLICLGVYPLLICTVLLREWGFEALAVPVIQFLGKWVSRLISELARISLYPGNVWTVPHWAILCGLLLSLWMLFLHSYFIHRSGAQKKIFLIATVAILMGSRSLINAFTAHPHSINIPSKPSISKHPISIETAVPQAAQVEQLDVGQGDAALVYQSGSPSRVGMVDCGAQQALTDIQWLELFAERQIKALSWIALTHLDEDHAGGLLRLSRLLPIGCVALPAAYGSTQRGKSLKQFLSKRGIPLADWDSKCIPFPKLSPPKQSSPLTPNGAMGAIWIPLEKGGFYLSAGDANKMDEIRIGNWAKRLSQNRNSPRILKISHHGSKTSTSSQWLKAIRPDEAWISVGAGNRYGHPVPAVISLLQKFKIPIRRTDRDGYLASQPRATAEGDHRPQPIHPQ